MTDGTTGQDHGALVFKVESYQYDTYLNAEILLGKYLALEARSPEIFLLKKSSRWR